ncbi:MAG: 3-hydroxyacyl-CoA dehydrogenase NAD-binding domain-containing protein [Albidovulum sp.]
MSKRDVIGVVGVVGLGAMGLGIAQIFAQAGFAVLATDTVPSARDSAVARIKASLGPRVTAGKLSAQAFDATMNAVHVVDGLTALAPACMVVEAIHEDMPAKQALWAKLEGIVAQDCILASNTSALSITAMAQNLMRPERLLGLHFFNPAPVMKLVELVGHAGSSAQLLAAARSLAEASGKTVIACADRPGFVVNRCARPFYGEALALLEAGRSACDIDAAMLAAGYRLGPFALIDLIGADINLAATEGLSRAMNRHPRYHVFEVLRAQVARGDLGRKSGRGFIYPDAVGPDLVGPDLVRLAPADAGDIAARIEAVLVNEAVSLVAEGATRAEDVDTAMRLGLNFPRGPFETLRLYGAGVVQETLKGLEKAAPEHLRGRYTAAGNLKDFA